MMWLPSSDQPKRVVAITCILAILSARTTTVLASTSIPEPTGPYVTGVHDFEFLDTTYPSDESNGYRLMGRIWYPACFKSNFQSEEQTEDGAPICNTPNGGSTAFTRRRELFEPGEFEITSKPLVDIMMLYMDLSDLLVESKNTGVSYSYVDVPPIDLLTLEPTAAQSEQRNSDGQDITTLPLIVYSHGGASHVGQSTSQMEELASHGYIVVSVAHPGFATGIIYPNNGDVRTMNPEFQIAMFADNDGSDGIFDSNITTRYLGRKARVERTTSGLAQFVPRGRDDNLAMVDYLSQSNHHKNDPILAALGISETPTVIYMGHSYGGCVSASAAQVDDRAIGVMNFDGTHQWKDLFDTAIRVPIAIFITEPLNTNYTYGAYYTNEFHYEPLVTMGSDPIVSRIHTPGINHWEFGDIVFHPNEERQAIPGAGYVDSMIIHTLIISTMHDFIETITDGAMTWSPQTIFKQFPGLTQPVDLSYVAEWAQEYFEDEEIVVDAPPLDSASAPLEMCTLTLMMGLMVTLLNFSRMN